MTNQEVHLRISFYHLAGRAQSYFPYSIHLLLAGNNMHNHRRKCKRSRSQVLATRSLWEQNDASSGIMHNLVIGGDGQTTLSPPKELLAAEDNGKVDKVPDIPVDAPADNPAVLQTTPTLSATSDVTGLTTASSSASAPTATSTIPLEESSYNSRPPPFYVGIALGCLAACAFIATLVAWYIRSRRRKRPVVPPWASKGYSFATTATKKKQKRRVHETLVGLGILIDEEIAVWEPRGDRDVGEPKRGEEERPGVKEGEKASAFAQCETPGYGAFETVHLTPAAEYALQHQQHLSPNSYNGTLQSQALAHRNRLGPLQVTNYITGDCRSSPSSSKVVPSPLTRMLLSSDPALERDDLNALRALPGEENPRYTTLHDEGPVPVPSRQLSDIPPLPYPGDPEPATTISTQSWLKSTYDSFFTSNPASQDDGLTPAPRRHANPLLPTHQSTEDVMGMVGVDSLVGIPSKPSRACTRRRDRGRDFEVGKLMSRPALASRASSIYSTTTLASLASRRSAASVSSSVYAYYGYKKSRAQRTKSSSSPTHSMSRRSSSSSQSVYLSKRSKLSISQKKLSTGSRKSSGRSNSTRSRIPIRPGGPWSRAGSMRSIGASEEMFARKAMLDRRKRSTALDSVESEVKEA